MCGMIFRGISHSAISDMQTIQQEAPSRSRNKDQDLDLYSTRSSTRDRDRDFFEDELDAMSGLSSKLVLLLVVESLSCKCYGSLNGEVSVMFVA